MRRLFAILAFVAGATALAFSFSCHRNPPGGTQPDLTSSWAAAERVDPDARTKFTDDDARNIFRAEQLIVAATLQMSKDDNDGAEYKIEDAIRISPSKKQIARAGTVRAALLVKKSAYEAAAGWYTFAIENGYNVADSYYQRAWCKIRAAKRPFAHNSDLLLREANADLAEAVRMDPSLQAKADELRR